jgi:AcrR family transcriptional regulator
VPPTARPATTTPADSTRVRLLDATGVALARYGPRKLSLTDKEELLLALAEHEKQRYDTELAAALHGLEGAKRLDRALRFMVEFQQDYPMRGLVVIEPAFMLEQLETSLRARRASLIPLFEQLGPRAARGGAGPADLADLVVRTALSHFLIAGDDDTQLLRELRHIAGLPG